MPKRSLFFLLLGLGCIGLAMLLNLVAVLWPKNPSTFISAENVRGMAIEHHGLLYTLNYEQQNQTLDILNLAKPFHEESIPRQDLDFEKIVIYRFHGDDIEIKPIAWLNQELAFSSPSWNGGTVLQEKSSGLLQTLLSETYDH